MEHGTGREVELYRQRFSPSEEATRQQTWEILCSQFFSRFVAQDSTVLDLGAGDGLFICNIQAKRRIAVDLSPHVEKLSERGIEVLRCPAEELRDKLNCKPDVVFMSNFLEHLPSKRVVLEVISCCRDILAPGGKLLILQPNIRYVGSAYWDYIDHHVALTEHSLVEGLEVSGFTVNTLIPQFLPYTVKSKTGLLTSKLPTKAVVGFYLKCPLLWRVFGGQTFVEARA